MFSHLIFFSNMNSISFVFEHLSEFRVFQKLDNITKVQPLLI